MHASSIADLGRSGITPDDAEKAGLFDVADASTIYPEFRREPALVIPYFDSKGEPIYFAPGKVFCRVRYVDPPKATGSFVNKKLPKYGQPKLSGTRAYFAPLQPWHEILEDVATPVVICEGEKKAIAGCLRGYPVIALGGVFNFTEGYKLLPELAAAKWKGRTVYIVFDSDAVSNPNILAAEARLVDELAQRGAKCVIVRLPPEGDTKVGLDDFLVAHGAAEFETLVRSAPTLGALDVKCLALNKDVAWIEGEGLVYDIHSNTFIRKENFVNGSVYSSIKHITVGGAQRSAPKTISVASTWLQHPHAQRYSEILFRPNEGSTVVGENGRPALNMWRPWEPVEGDVTPFLALDKFLFQWLPPEHRDLPLKLMAYKAQNPQIKFDKAIVLIGPQGCGKTLWGECIRDAFRPYSTDVSSKSFHSDFQGWLEKSLVILINEAEHEDMQRGSEILKTLISDGWRDMNEKYRKQRNVKTYCQFILTSNERAVGAFEADDRRMVVVDCPPRTLHGDEATASAFYDRVAEWKQNGGPKALLGYLLRMDLKGWKPPAMPPMTSEKYMAHIESLTPTERLAADMLSADEHVLKQWLDGAYQWAVEGEQSGNPITASRARAVKDNIPRYSLRPFYTPEELSMMFPVIVEQIMGVKYQRTTPAGQLSTELRNAGITYLKSKDDPRGFRWKGQVRQYLVIHNTQDWQAPISQADFERIMSNAPLYRQVMGRK